MKANLIDVAKDILALINEGHDFIVREYKFGNFIKLPIIKEDSEPHVCDFLKAGLEKELVAYYFAYLLCTPGHEIYSTKNGNYLNADMSIKPTFQDQKVINEIIDEFWEKADDFKSQRKSNKEDKQEL